MTRSLRLSDEQYKALLAKRAGYAKVVSNATVSEIRAEPTRMTVIVRKRNKYGARKPVVPSAHANQVAVIDWWKWACKSYGLDERTLFAIPNASKQKDTGRFWRAREGLRAGVPDLFLAYASNGHGLFIEMKAHGKKPNEAQRTMLAMLKTNGYAVAVCNSADAAIETIKAYLR